MAGVHVELDAGLHARADAANLILFEIGIHPPLAVVDELKQRLARFDVLPRANAEAVADVAIHGRVVARVVEVGGG